MLTQWEAFEPSPPPLRVRGAGEQGPEPALRGFGGRGWNVSPRSAVSDWTAAGPSHAGWNSSVTVAVTATVLPAGCEGGISPLGSPDLVTLHPPTSLPRKTEPVQGRGGFCDLCPTELGPRDRCTLKLSPLDPWSLVLTGTKEAVLRGKLCLPLGLGLKGKRAASACDVSRSKSAPALQLAPISCICDMFSLGNRLEILDLS